MASTTKLNIRSLCAVFLIINQLVVALPSSVTPESVINSTLPNYGSVSDSDVVVPTTDEPSKVISYLYESTVERNADSRALDMSTTTVATKSATTTISAPPSTSMEAIPNSGLQPAVQTTTLSTPTMTTTAAPETTTNPQQMLIPPALVNASIAQMPNAKASTHKQGQIIIRYNYSNQPKSYTPL